MRTFSLPLPLIAMALAATFAAVLLGSAVERCDLARTWWVTLSPRQRSRSQAGARAVATATTSTPTVRLRYGGNRIGLRGLIVVSTSTASVKVQLPRLQSRARLPQPPPRPSTAALWQQQGGHHLCLRSRDGGHQPSPQRGGHGECRGPVPGLRCRGLDLGHRLPRSDHDVGDKTRVSVAFFR